MPDSLRGLSLGWLGHRPQRHGDGPRRRARSMKQLTRRERTMAELIEPDAFSERFVCYLDANGRPVKRALRYMTADQVFDAIGLHRAVADHWQAAADPFSCDGDDFELYPGMSVGDVARRLRGEADLCERSAMATALYVRVTKAALSVIPPNADRDMPLLDLLRRYWPGGRHAAARSRRA
jgi:hypothetical protein